MAGSRVASLSRGHLRNYAECDIVQEALKEKAMAGEAHTFVRDPKDGQFYEELPHRTQRPNGLGMPLEDLIKGTAISHTVESSTDLGPDRKIVVFRHRPDAPW
jgi:hypothetical protein